MKADKIEALLSEGVKSLDARHYGRARQRFVKVLDVDKGSLSGWFYLALAELGLGKLTEAEACVRRVITRDRCHLNANLNLGVIKMKQGNVEQALRAYQRELRLNPDCNEAHYNLGDIYSAWRKWKKVIFHLEKCWRAGHVGEGIEEGLAIAATKAGRYDLVEEVYRGVLKNEPESVWALNNLAACCNHIKKHSEALSLLQKALAIDPKDEIVRENLLDTEQLMKR